MEKTHGCIVIDKPSGMTSHDVVYRLRKHFQMKKIGHTGTLDPETTGVLVLCLGEATKLIQYLPEKEKSYLATVTLGRATTTEDFTGETTIQEPVPDFSVEQIDACLEGMKELKEQIPPMYSAIKMNGQKLVNLARKNIEIERKPRPIEVFDLKRTSELLKQDKELSFSFEVTATKGFYVRSFCVEIGKRLGVPAHMSYLRRTKSGQFSINDAVTLEQLENNEYHLISMENMVPFELYKVPDSLIKQVRNGMKVPNPGFTSFVFMMQDRVLALYQAKGEQLEPVKVFYYGND